MVLFAWIRLGEGRGVCWGLMRGVLVTLEAI